jgi:hypothetical protein
MMDVPCLYSIRSRSKDTAGLAGRSFVGLIVGISYSGMSHLKRRLRIDSDFPVIVYRVYERSETGKQIPIKYRKSYVPFSINGLIELSPEPGSAGDNLIKINAYP